jgi:PadR family transcriptional regulator, regulatory protein PadR
MVSSRTSVQPLRSVSVAAAPAAFSTSGAHPEEDTFADGGNVLVLTNPQPEGTIPKLIMGAKQPPPMGELLPGTLDMLILKTLSRGPLHGYGVAQFIQQASADVLRVEEGALYPALHRLEVRGWLKATWGISDNNRRAKFYRLSALGRRELDAEAGYWKRVAAAVTQVMETP